MGWNFLKKNDSDHEKKFGASKWSQLVHEKQAYADKSPSTDPTYGPEVMPMTVLKCSRWNFSTTLITHNHDVQIGLIKKIM
jgi:hypothetical protein